VRRTGPTGERVLLVNFGEDAVALAELATAAGHDLAREKILAASAPLEGGNLAPLQAVIFG
jgi:hypothetical protein